MPAYINVYGTLGLDPNATAEQIKENYSRLSLKFHPDKNMEDEKEEKERKGVSAIHHF